MVRMRSRRSVAAGLVLLLCAAGPVLAADSARSPLHGALPAGRHAVGFTRLSMADPTRPSRPAPENGPPEARARRIDVYVWYPAAAGSPVAPMTFADAMVTEFSGRAAADRTRREA